MASLPEGPLKRKSVLISGISKHALKACDVLKAEIQAKLAAKGVTAATLTILPRGDLAGHGVVGRCEGNTKMIVLTRTPHVP